MNTQVDVQPSDGFVLTPALERVVERALSYLRSGYPVHFCGQTGTGKTTLAFHVAAQLGRPIVLLHGDHLFTSADLVGTNAGTRTSRLIDNYVRSVVKMEEESRELWVDNRLTTACRLGHTLIYDEFNRTTPEANNPLLSVFSERILNLPKAHDGRESYINVHKRFAAILTSNPEEYAGVHRTPDALMDRLITIHLQDFDLGTEESIVAARSGVAPAVAHEVTRLVREIRQRSGARQRPTVRAAITISRILAATRRAPDREDPFFRGLLADVLGIDLRHADALQLSSVSDPSPPDSEVAPTGGETMPVSPEAPAVSDPPEMASVSPEATRVPAPAPRAHRPSNASADDPFADHEPEDDSATPARRRGAQVRKNVPVWLQAVRSAESNG